MRKVSKAVALLLVLALLVSLAACGTPKNNNNTAAPKNYTYNYALAEFPTTWSPHTNQTNIDSEIMDYIVSGLYAFDYKDEKHDGYKLVPLAAKEEPKDVTSQYIGKYGLVEGDTKKAYIIPLRDDLKWDDGTKITANDYVESAKRLLSPKAKNYRADSLYSGNLVIHNAQNYLNAGQTINLDNGANAGYELADLTKKEDGTYVTPDGGAVYLAVNFPLDWTSGNTLKDYVEAYGESYFSLKNWDTLVGMMDDDGLIPLTDENLALYGDVTTGNPAWNETAADLPNYFVYAQTYPELDFAEVGIAAVSDTELLLVLDKQLSGFYLLYSLTDTWLVKLDLYDKCESIVDGVYNNTYGTSVETTASFGPYKLTDFQADKQYTLTKNENWFGFKEGTYQATAIVVDSVPDPNTRLQLFLQGKLDSYGLDRDHMEEYSKSDYCYYTPGDSTYAMVFNPNLGALKSMQENEGANVNKTIITLKEFRMAMSLGLDRAKFCLATSPTNNAAFALYSTLIVSNPDEGTAYRTTEQAKKVLVDFWGLTEDIGAGKLYPDMDAAIESITGYNLTKAQEYFNAAYDKAIATGLMDEDDKVVIMIGTPNNTSAFYNAGYDYIVNNYTEAVKGTKLEGKLEFKRDDTLGNGFSDALKNNQVDMLFGVGWTGSTLDPYGLMEAYTSSTYQYDPAFNTSSEKLTINIGGVDYTASLVEWNDIMTGTAHTITAADGTTKEYSCGEADNDPETRLDILAALEGAILLQYDFIPIMDASSAGLRGMQIKYFTEDYVFGMGRGGIQYYTFNYDDEAWDKYVTEQGGTLNYK
ncbi:MAG: hypothetical protein IJM80_06515 [Firmicutes bacterium]|nr:hypothetical protein [Bacillota bacterium]